MRGSFLCSSLARIQADLILHFLRAVYALLCSSTAPLEHLRANERASGSAQTDRCKERGYKCSAPPRFVAANNKKKHAAILLCRIGKAVCRSFFNRKSFGRTLSSPYRCPLCFVVFRIFFDESLKLTCAVIQYCLHLSVVIFHLLRAHA